MTPIPNLGCFPPTLPDHLAAVLPAGLGGDWKGEGKFGGDAYEQGGDGERL